MPEAGVVSRWQGLFFQYPVRASEMKDATVWGAFAPSSSSVIVPQLVSIQAVQVVCWASDGGGAAVKVFAVLGAGGGVEQVAPAEPFDELADNAAELPGEPPAGEPADGLPHPAGSTRTPATVSSATPWRASGIPGLLRPRRTGCAGTGRDGFDRPADRPTGTGRAAAGGTSASLGKHVSSRPARRSRAGHVRSDRQADHEADRWEEAMGPVGRLARC